MGILGFSSRPSDAPIGWCVVGPVEGVSLATYATWVMVLDSTVDEVVGVLGESGGPALVGVDGAVVVVFALDDTGDVESPTAQLISVEMGCVSVAVSVHDDVLVVFVYRDGDVEVAGAVADPDSEFAEGAPPLDGDELVVAIGRGDADALAVALSADVDGVDRAVAVSVALGLPAWPVGWGYEQLIAARDGFDGPTLVSIDSSAH